MKFTLFISAALIAVDINAQAFIKEEKGPIVNNGGDSHGAAWADYDGDGWIDLFVANLNGPDFLYKNLGNGTFTKIFNVITEGSYNSASGMWADYDGDCDLDLFVCVGSTIEAKKNKLFKNMGNGTFKSVVESEVGSLLSFSGFTESAAWGDVDLDGDLDLFEVNWRVQPNLLHINNGEGLFSLDSISGVTNDYDWAITANWVDFNLDQKMDLFVARQGYPITGNKGQSYLLSNHNSLYVGTGYSIENSFNEYDPIVSSGGNSITSSWGDFNNDGYPDLFIGNFDNQGNSIFINMGGKAFKRADSVLGPTTGFSVGSAIGDVDNDGCLDLIVSNGYGTNAESNFMYVGKCNGSFDWVDNDPIVIDKVANVSCSLADIDNDGDLDAFFVSRNDENNLLFVNQAQKNWIKILPQSRFSCKVCLGCKIVISYSHSGKLIYQYREISQQSGYGGHGELGGHFGLNDVSKIDTVKVRWPDAQSLIITGVKANREVIVDYPSKLENN